MRLLLIGLTLVCKLLPWERWSVGPASFPGEQFQLWRRDVSGVLSIILWLFKKNVDFLTRTLSWFSLRVFCWVFFSTSEVCRNFQEWGMLLADTESVPFSLFRLSQFLFKEVLWRLGCFMASSRTLWIVKSKDTAWRIRRWFEFFVKHSCNSRVKWRSRITVVYFFFIG